MNDILQYAVDNGIIDLRGVAEECALRKREETLSKHHIWKGKNGYYYSKVNGKLVKKKKLSDLNEYLLNGQNHVEQIFNEFLDRKRNLQPSTITRYKTTFNSYLTDIKDKNIELITEWDIEELILGAIANGLTAKEYAGIRTVLNGIFKLARKKELVEFKISDTLEDLNLTSNDFRSKQHKKQVLNTDEHHTITEYLKEHQDILNLGLLLMLKTGLRIGELVALKPSDLGKCYINVSKTEQRANGKYEIIDKTKTEAGQRQVVLADQDLWILRELRARRTFSEYVFDFRSYQFRQRLYKVCDEIGIERIGLHKLRKTYASRLFIQGLDEQFICSQMGHTDISCTKQYYIKDTLTVDEKRRLLRVT